MLAKLPGVKGFSSLVEPLYAPGHVLMDDDLTAGVLFTRNLSRLLFRSLFGCGVICGYKVTASLECERLKISIAPGVALDCHGDPVELSATQSLCVGEKCGDKIPDTLWVVIRGMDHNCAPRELACPSDDEDDACGCHATRAKAGFELKVLEREPCGACGCAEKTGQPTTTATPTAPAPAQPPMLLARTLPPEERANLDHLASVAFAARQNVQALTTQTALANAAVSAARDQADSAAQALDKAQAAATDANKATGAKAVKAAQDTLDQQNKAYADAVTVAKANAAQLAEANTGAGKALADAEAAHSAAGVAMPQEGVSQDLTQVIAPPDPCHTDHYAGVCACCCGDGCDGWVVLARIYKAQKPADPSQPYAADHNVRRFVRPVLAADPLAGPLS